MYRFSFQNSVIATERCQGKVDSNKTDIHNMKRREPSMFIDHSADHNVLTPLHSKPELEAEGESE